MIRTIKLYFFALVCILSSISLANSENTNYIKQFNFIFDKIGSEYVEEPNKQKMIDSAINGMLTSLDPHSYYFTDDELQDFINQTEGHFGGIGVEIIYEDGLIKIISPIEDLPAEKAGMQSGDYVISIDDEPVKNLGFYKALKKMRGDPGTKVKLKIVREGTSTPIELELVRDVVKIKAVKFKEDNNIAYVRITTFNENTMRELKSAFQELKKNRNLEGIILDLRNNPGGLMDQAIKVSEYFINSGKIVSTKGRNAINNATFSANPFSDKAPKLKMVTLINSGSASAAEIVAGALQDHKRSIILGTKSFGKGSVQVFAILNERAGIKFTISKYYTPNDRCIQAEGIEPDIKVEMAKVEYSNPDDESKKFFEKSFSNHLKNNKKEKPIDSDKTKDLKKSQANDMSDLYKSDYQYARAFDLLKSLNIIADISGGK